MSQSHDDFTSFVLDQLSRLSRVTAKKMFGGVGLYQDVWFFAVVDAGRLYFLTDEHTRPRYEALGMKPFEYAPGKVIPSYYEVPVDILEDDTVLCQWANEAVKAQKIRSAGRVQPSAPSPPPRSSARGHRPRGGRRREGTGPGSGERRRRGAGGNSHADGNSRPGGNSAPGKDHAGGNRKRKASRKRSRRGGRSQRSGSPSPRRD